MSYNYSLILDGDLSRDDPLFWSRPTTANCSVIRVLGIFLCIGAFIGILCNGALFFSFLRYKYLRTPPNIFIMFISAIGLFASITILPLTGTSSIFCYWLYQRAGCQLGAIIAFLYGCSSSYLLCGVSLSRYYIIIRPFEARNVTVRKCVIISLIAIGLSLLWTLLPLFGWNEYTMDGAGTSCCINWYDRRPLYVSYLYFLFVFVYVIPLAILITTNTLTLIGLKRMHEQIERGIQTGFNQKRIDMERRIIQSVLVTTSGFIFTWTPYAVTFLVSAFQGKDYALPPMATFICTCFAKTSVIWIPLLYMSHSTQFGLRVVNREVLERNAGGNRIDATIMNTLEPAKKLQNPKKTSL